MSAEHPRHVPTPFASTLALILIMGITFTAAAIGASASVNSGSFYMGLARPSWAPPPGVFGPVWSVLYFMMGAAAWLVWRRVGLGPAGRLPLGLYLGQLVANSLWSVFFFGNKNGAVAFVDILVLDVLVILTAIYFYRVRSISGLMFIPYTAWVLFATALSFAVWRMNPEVLG